MKLLLLTLCFVPFLLFGQTNESDSLRFKASLSVTGLFQGGNVQTSIFRSKSELSITTLNSWVFKTKNSYVYQAFSREKADEDILSLNFLYFHPEKKVYPLLIGIASTNFRREIDLRYLVGTGVSFQILNEKEYWLKFSLSSEYEETRFVRAEFNNADYDGSALISTFRGTLWINGKYHLLEDKLIVGHESYFQPSLSDPNNFRWQADLSLELPISKYFNFKVNYLDTFESIVIEDQRQEDRLLTFGLTIKSF